MTLGKCYVSVQVTYLLDSAKLDRRTKQHNEFGVSASNSSKDIARTKVAEKKEKKKRKKKKEEKK